MGREFWGGSSFEGRGDRSLILRLILRMQVLIGGESG
jgi:hypothetical protein